MEVICVFSMLSIFNYFKDYVDMLLTAVSFRNNSSKDIKGRVSMLRILELAKPSILKRPKD